MAEGGGERLSERIVVNGAAAESALEVDGTLRWRSGGGEQCLRLESEVLGLDVQGTRITVRALAEAPRSGSICAFGGASGERRRVRRDYSLEMPTEAAALRWSARLKNCIDSLGRPKKLFVILNPFAGNKSARTIFEKQIKPILEAGYINYTIVETKYQNHAQEMTKSLDLPKYDGIVCVSGDGVLVEVVNGLLKREDWATAIKMPLGIIPAGTGNGMAKSLLDSAGDMYSIANATFAIIRGRKRVLDVATISQKEKRFFSVLTLIWGLAADVDIESEKYRWLGSARLDIYALLRIMNLRKYHGHFQFIPAPGYENHGEPVERVDEAKSHYVLTQQEQGSDSKFKTCGYQGPENSLDGLEWRFVDGPFISIWANNVPFSAENYAPAPKAKFSDGYLDVVILKDCPKSAILGMMLNMSDGSYVKSPYIMYLKVKALRLEPGKRIGHDAKGGIIDCDGEVLAMGDDAAESNVQKHFMAYGPLLVTVDQGLATIFTPVP
ncbi:sphingosine kinase 1-like [Curcuma longa]|uniref:sphingosine kinase 1-like n=1 Tax=Curcuma longa TaxID=136217 RepID=UPI003D9F978B